MSVDPRRLCQIEIAVGDVRRAAQFYEDAFGWRPVPAEMHEYVVLAVPDGCPFGIALVPGRSLEGRVGGAVLYFAVEDPEAVVERVMAAGGRKRLGPSKLFGYGVIHQVEDPDGTRWGLYAAIPAKK